jgi:hypothetical protein
VLGLIAVASFVSFVAWLAFTFTRPLATRGDLEQLVAGRVNDDAALASQICGAPVRGLMWPTPALDQLRYGEWPWAKVELLSLKPAFSRDGTVTSRVSGVGVDAQQKAVTGMHAARITFSYHCAWEDNGRSNNFRCSMTAPPIVVSRE